MLTLLQRRLLEIRVGQVAGISIAATRHGMRLGGSLSIWRRTSATRHIPLLSWPPIPMEFPSRERFNICRWAVLWRNTRGRRIVPTDVIVTGQASCGTEQAGAGVHRIRRAVFHHQIWRPEQAYSFLENIPLFEQSVQSVVRIPDWWKAGRPPRPQVTVRIGEAGGKLLGAESLLDFKVHMSLEGEPLTEVETKKTCSEIRQWAGIAQGQVG